MSGDENGFDRDRTEIHEALSHPTRVRILQILARSPLGFSELKREAGLESGGLLSFHLGKLAGLVKAEEGKYSLTERGKEALGMVADDRAPKSTALRISCNNCGSIMESFGKQAFRTGELNEAVSALISLEWGMPIPFETYVCKKCGKVELFADDTARKLMRGEYAGDSLTKCPRCQKQYAKDIEKCPYCGAISPRFRAKP